MRYSTFALLVISLSLTACKVPDEIAKQPTPQKPVAREQVNAIEQRKKIEEMKDEEPMDHAHMDHENMDHDNMDMNDEPTDDHGGWVDQAGDAGQYTAMIDGVVGNGVESVLFFHASWCPACKKNDGILKTLYETEDFPRSVYKIDFDTADELRKEYGVTGQDTFILIDGNGNEIERVAFPSQSALRALLG